ncbi:MAG: flagellar hook-basal body protein [Lachnospiraceae bacterium]|nr:flagellar hook-basal body protein [Lachnospiraceae bacterium]MDD7178893.1 flagellar hook-basal body protein [bacterium]MDY5518167.1 flagellar hook-basal body protein [Lachnospiraceae bacterium]
MMRALWSAASGMLAQQTNVDTIANNLANVNTTGYRSEKAEFKSLLYQTLQTRTTTANGEQKPISAQVGLGTRVSSMTSSFKGGEMIASESNTAFAIEGDGFFGIQGVDGELNYTRNGDFFWTNGTDGLTLATAEGYYVLDRAGNPIVIPEGVDTNTVEITASGEVGYKTPDGNFVSLNQTIGLWQFNNPAGLEKVAGTYFQETAASGNALNESTAGVNLIPSKLRRNYLESSNVQVADEMVNLIVAQRAYELNSKAIQSADTMLGQANQLKQ